jgi:hypothetical protein
MKNMVMFTVLVNYSTEYFCNARVAGLGEFFIRVSSRKKKTFGGEGVWQFHAPCPP